MKILALIPLLALTACAGAPPVNLCKYAEARRATYTSTIAAADAYAASGYPVPEAVTLGRLTAVTALAVLNTNCPVA